VGKLRKDKSQGKFRSEKGCPGEGPGSHRTRGGIEFLKGDRYPRSYHGGLGGGSSSQKNYR